MAHKSSCCPMQTRHSRRQFLRRASVLAGAGVGLPQLLPAGVLAAEGRPGANDRIGLAGIGVGRQGGGLMKGFGAMPIVRLIAMADVNLVRAREMAQSYEADVVQDYRRVLERKDVDAIVTATPEQWRSLICLHACQAGKDLYVEKPMSLTIREGRLIVEAVHKYGRVFQTGSQQRSMSANRKGCELIRNGRIGRVTRVVGHNYPSPWEGALPGQPVPTDLDWEQWCGPAPLTPFHPDLLQPRANPGWLSFRPFSGGEMTGWGSHGFDQVQWALGMDQGGPVEVWTEGPKFAPPTYTEPENRDRGDKLCARPKVFFRYPGDIVMELGDGPAGGARFIGERGTLTIDRDICKSDPPELAAEPLENPSVRLERSTNHAMNWLECIKSRQRPIADVEIGHRSATVCHLGNIARWTGRRLRWDPVKEVFPDDAAANEYLDRARRPGYELPATL